MDFMTYKMLVSDIDGTLLNSRGQLTAGVKQAIREAHEHGVIVTLATGRQLRGVVPLIEELGVSVPVILGNGCVIVDPLKGETLLHRPLAHDATHAILDVIQKHGLWSSLMVHTYEGVDTYYDRDPGFEEAYLFIHKDLDPQVAVEVGDLRPHVSRDPIKVLLIDRTEKVMPLAEELTKLRQTVDFNMVVSHQEFPGYTFLETFHHLSTKAAGIEHLTRQFQLTPSQVVAVGDNVNDLEMIEYAGLGVAMGNAVAELKARADWTTTSHDEDGIAHLIHSKILA